MTGGGAAVPDVRIILSGIWVAVMLIYLLGDVLRIISGDADEFMRNGLDGKPLSQRMWLGIAVMMLVPIVMVVLSLTLPYPAIRWITFVAAGGFFLMNAGSLNGYPGHYDKFLLGVSLVFNLLTIWYAWTWQG